jgi:hypothetical protein
MRIIVALLLAAVPVFAADIPFPLNGDLSGDMIYDVRVTNDLVLWSDQSGTHVLDVTHNALRPAIDGIVRNLAETQSGALLLYEGSETLRVAALDANGNIATDRELARRRTGGAIAANGDRALVFAYDGDAFLLDLGGNLVRAPFRVTNTPAFSPAVAAAGDGFVVSWSHEWAVHTARVSRDGVVTPGRLFDAQGGPSLASDGSAYLLLWHADGDKLYGSIDGGAPFTIATTTGMEARAFWNGREFVVLYEWLADFDDLNPKVFEARVEVNGTVQTLGRIPDVVAPFYDAAPALTAWISRNACLNGEALMLRVGDGAAVAISKGTPHQFSPALASTFALHAERSDRTRLYLGRTLLSERAARNVAPVVSDGGAHTLVVWTEDRGEFCERSLEAAIVSRDGAVLRKFTISHDVLGRQKTALAWTGTEYAVVWERATANQLLGATFDADGNRVVAPTPLTESRERGSYVTAVMFQPGVAWDGDELVLVWQRLFRTDIPFYTDPPAQFDVRRQYLTASLAPKGAAEVLDPIGLAPTLSIGADRGLIAWRLEGTSDVRLRVVTRATGTTVVQREVAGGGDPLLSAPFGDEFVLVTATQVLLVLRNGTTIAQEPLPAGAVPGDLRVERQQVSIAYTVGERAYVRVMTVEGTTGRRRAVRR